VIERIRSVAGEVRLLVVDVDTDKFYRSQNVVVSGSTSDIDVAETPSSNPAKSAPAAADEDENCKYTSPHRRHRHHYYIVVADCCKNKLVS